MILRSLSVALVATLALGAASSASALEFEGSKGEGTLKVTGGLDELTLGGPRLVCENIGGGGRSSTLVQTSLILLLVRRNCTFAGSSVTVQNNTALFDANGGFIILPSDRFVMTSAVGKCSVLLAPEGTTKSLGTIKYVNESNGTISEGATIKGIPYEVRGAAGHTLCGTSKELGESTEVGSATIELEGGTIKVK